MTRRDEMETEFGKFLFDNLPERVSLLFVDRNDELPSGFYREALESGWKAREVVQDFLDEYVEPYKWESAAEVVISTAAEHKMSLHSPLVSVEAEDWYALIDEVMERDDSDGWNYLMDIAARDRVLVGVPLEGEFALGSDPAEIAAAFGVTGRVPEWAVRLSSMGEGVPTVLCAVDGDDLLGMLRDAYVAEGSDPSAVTVKARGRDVGLLNRLYGSGWFEDYDSPIGVQVEVSFDDFVSRAWIDNEPGARGTWTEVVGQARATGAGELTLHVAPK